MESFASAELTRSPREVTLAAERGPVTITQHRKPRYVLMTVAHYEQLCTRAEDPRRVYRTSDIPENIRQELIDALEGQIIEEDRPDGD